MENKLESYWGSSNKTRWGPEVTKTPLVAGTLMHLRGELAIDAVDIIIVRQRIKEVTQRLNINDYEGELIPRNEQFNPVYNEEGKRIVGTNEKTRIRLVLEKQALEKEGLPSNTIYQVFFYFIF
jgi:hypothetical protein